MSKIFYKSKLVADEEGLVIVTERFVSIHETRCFHFVVPESSAHMLDILKGKDETQLQYAKRRKMLKRIDKRGSRIAFETEEAAFDHLQFLKRKQLRHMERETAFINFFLGTHTYEETRNNRQVISGSRDLVHEYYSFDF